MISSLLSLSLSLSITDIIYTPMYLPTEFRNTKSNIYPTNLGKKENEKPYCLKDNLNDLAITGNERNKDTT